MVVRDRRPERRGAYSRGRGQAIESCISAPQALHYKDRYRNDLRQYRILYSGACRRREMWPKCFCDRRFESYRVLYIGGGLFGVLAPDPAPLVVAADLLGVAAAILSKVARVLLEPALGVAVAPLEVVRTRGEPALLVRLLAGLLALGDRAGDLA